MCVTNFATSKVREKFRVNAMTVVSVAFATVGGRSGGGPRLAAVGVQNPSPKVGGEKLYLSLRALF